MDNIIFTSLGMFIIDDNEYPPSWNRPNEHNIIGGAGSYSIVGARIIGGHKLSKTISGIIDKGNDFPESVKQELDSWNTGTIFRNNPHRLTTRGLNIYDENEIRHFKYLSDKKRIEFDDVLQYKQLLHSKSFHLICAIDRCKGLINDITPHNSTAKFIYEPLPDACVSENYDTLKDILPYVDIFTPNLNEACQFLGKPMTEDINTIIVLAQEFHQHQAKDKDAGVVLRCGALGCVIVSNSVSVHLPAYHQHQSKVVDVTGGGNSFCGGFMMGYYLSQDWVIGGMCGNIASGVVIEKLGIPVVSDNEGDSDTWNDESIESRVEKYGETNGLQTKGINWL